MRAEKEGKMASDILKEISDAELFNETANRLMSVLEANVGKKLAYGEVVFIFHAGKFVRIDCQASLRAFVAEDKDQRTTLRMSL